MCSDTYLGIQIFVRRNCLEWPHMVTDAEWFI